MSDVITVAIIQGFVGVVLLLLGAKLNGKINSVRDDAKATRHQVENNHDTNLREEADERHNENSRKLDKLGHSVVEILSIVSRHTDLLTTHSNQIDGLTHPPQPHKEHNYERLQPPVE